AVGWICGWWTLVGASCFLLPASCFPLHREHRLIPGKKETESAAMSEKFYAAVRLADVRVEGQGELAISGLEPGFLHNARLTVGCRTGHDRSGHEDGDRERKAVNEKEEAFRS